VRLLALTLVAAGIAGCDNFALAFCQTDRDCSGGARCEPTAGICVVGPDAGAPGGGSGNGGSGGGGGVAAAGGGAGGGMIPEPTQLTVLVPTRPARPPSGGASYEDTPPAWRRNEALYITVHSTQPLTRAQLAIGTTVWSQPAAAASCPVPCTGHCHCFRVELWLPPLEGLRGTFTLTASGVDPSGATATASVPLPVTRFQWSRPVIAGHQIRATPALGADGTIYVGTSAGAALRTGSLVALSPTGLERWSKPLGRIEASPSLSAPGAGQRLYVGAVDALGGRLYAFSPAGALLGLCALSPVAGLEASPVVLGSGGAAFYSNGSRALISLLPGASPSCVSKSTGSDVPFPGNLVADGETVYFADVQPRLRRFGLEKEGNHREWKERTSGGWPGTLPSTWLNRSLALGSSNQLVGAGSLATGGGLFQATVGGSLKFDFGFPAAPGSVAPQSPVVATGGTARAGVPTGIAAFTGSSAVVGAGDPIRNAPALGQGGRLFALAENGAVSEWSAASPPVRRWSSALDPGPAPAFEASPTLDCARDPQGAPIPGLPGVLYAASRGGTLYAVIVDSRGIDATAGWPKYQKDPRNSGNASTGLAEFSCP